MCEVSEEVVVRAADAARMAHFDHLGESDRWVWVVRAVLGVFEGFSSAES